MNIQSILHSHIFKMRDTIFIQSLVDIEYISSFERIFIDGITDINIHEPIIIYINNRYSPFPPAHSSNTCDICYVFELKVPFIQIQFSGHHVTTKIYILQAIVIKITYANSTAVINIYYIHWIDGIVLSDFVSESN